MVKIFDVLTSSCIIKIKNSYGVCALNKLNENELIGGDWSGCFRIWNIHTDSLVISFYGHADWISQIIKINNNRIVSCSRDKTVKVFDIKTGECLKTFNEHTAYVHDILEISENQILSASWDKSIKLWNIENENNQSIKTFNGHTDRVYALLRMNEKEFLSGSRDKTVRKWNTETGECLKIMNCSYSIFSLVQVKENEVIFGGGYGGQIKKYDVSNEKLINIYRNHKNEVTKMIVIKENILISCSDSETIMMQKI